MSEQKPLDERPHQPTEGKLSRVRKEGDVAKSEEFSTGFRFLFILLAIAMLWENQVDSLKNLFISHLDRIAYYKSDDPILDFDLLLEASYPVLILAAVGLIASLAAKVIDIRGFVINTQGMKPSMSQLNPVNGIKEVFSLDSFLKFTSSFVKFVVITFAMIIIFSLHANSAIWSISCGIGCQLALGVTILISISGLYLLLLFVSAAIDMKVSRFLHRRKHRMSKQELRQEQRDNYGSPEMKGAQRGFRDELAEDDPETQAKANLVIYGASVAHALFVYADGPVIILQTLGAEFVKLAKESGVYCVSDEALTQQLSHYPQRRALPPQVNGMIRDVISKL
jgi:type III secretory pathway component EscU